MSLNATGLIERPQVPSAARKLIGGDLFAPLGHSADLRSRSLQAGAVVAGSQVLRFGLQLGSAAVLARLLTPLDFGLVAMAAVFVTFLGIFQDLGLSMATVRQQRISAEQVNTLHWLSVAIGAVLACIAVAVAPLVAWVFGDDRLIGITAALGATLLLACASTQQMALLNRALRFGTVTAIEVGSLAFGVGLAIVAAMLDAAYWARVLLPVGTAAARLVLVNIVCPWRPGWPRRATGVGAMIGFGGSVTGINVTTYLVRNVDRMFVGGMLGPVALGIYTRACELMMLPARQLDVPITTVAIPVLGRLQSDPPRFRRYFRAGLGCVAAVVIPVAALMIVAAPELVLLVLGDQWTDAAPLLRLMGPLMLSSVLSLASGWVCLALGRAGRQLRFGVVIAAGAIVAAAAGSRFGLEGVALGMAAVIALLRVAELVYCLRGAPVGTIDVVVAVWRPAVAAAAAALLVQLGVSSVVESAPIGWAALSMAASFGAAYVVLALLLPGGAAWARTVLDTMRRREPAT